MFKDLVLAIVFGAILGCGVTGGYYTYKNSQKTNIIPSISPIPQISSTPTETPQSDITLDIISPQNYDLYNKSSLTINGTSSPLSNIIINTPVGVYNGSSDEQGNFSVVCNLETGLNDVQVTAIDNNDFQTSTSLFITYSTNTPSLFAKSSDKTQDSTELAKERIEKIANPQSVNNQNKAYWGNITSIEDNQITISNDDTTYYLAIDSNTTKPKNLKNTQSILAMGQFDTTSNSLVTKRIITLDPKTIQKNYQVIIGTIADISKETSIIIIIPSKNKDTQYQIKTDQKDLKKGDKVIASLVPDPKIPKTFIALKIFPNP